MYDLDSVTVLTNKPWCNDFKIKTMYDTCTGFDSRSMNYLKNL